MRKIFDNWFYNFSSNVSFLFSVYLTFSILLYNFVCFINNRIFGFFVVLFYLMIITPIFVAKARDAFLKEMDLYVDYE